MDSKKSSRKSNRKTSNPSAKRKSSRKFNKSHRKLHNKSYRKTHKVKSHKKTSSSHNSVHKKGGRTYLPHPTSGALGDYSTTYKQAYRRDVLRNQVEKNSYASTMKDLNLRATLNKNKSPHSSEVMRKDMDYLRRTYRPEDYKLRKMKD